MRSSIILPVLAAVAFAQTDVAGVSPSLVVAESSLSSAASALSASTVCLELLLQLDLLPLTW